MKYLKFVFPCLFTLLVFSCNKDEEVELVTWLEECENCIELKNPAVGQRSVYVGFEGKNYIEESNPGIDYTTDTLVATIIDKDATGYLTEVVHNNPNIKRDTFYIIPESDSIRLRSVGQYSTLLVNFEREEEIVLVAGEVDGPKADPKGWEIGLDCGGDIINGGCNGYVEEFALGGEPVIRLNVYKNYAPMAYDGPGFFMLYDDQLGIVRSVSVGSWVPTGGGWDLIGD